MDRDREPERDEGRQGSPGSGAGEDPEALAAEDRNTDMLVVRFQGGDENAFSTLYTRYFNRVFKYLNGLLHDHHEAEDGTQQVFTQMFEKIGTYERRAGLPFRAWLFASARNYALAHLRKHGRVEAADPEEIARHIERAAAEGGDLADELGDLGAFGSLGWIRDHELLMFVERLPLAQRQVLLLRFLLDLNGPEIAEVLGRTHEDVRILLHRAISYLRDRLIAIGRGPGDSGGPRSKTTAYRQQATVLRARRFAL